MTISSPSRASLRDPGCGFFSIFRPSFSAPAQGPSLNLVTPPPLPPLASSFFFFSLRNPLKLRRWDSSRETLICSLNTWLIQKAGHSERIFSASCAFLPSTPSPLPPASHPSGFFFFMGRRRLPSRSVIFSQSVGRCQRVWGGKDKK